ncbi:MAG: tyramine oxidase, partial [Hyphomicrobiales bacterium]
TIAEVLAAVEHLKAAGVADDTTRYPMIRLKEAPKADVLAWQPGQAFARTAFVVMRQGGRTFEAEVDLRRGQVMSHVEIPDVQPNIMLDEWRLAGQLAKADRRWQDAMRKRGLTDFDRIFCAPTAAGYLPEPGFAGRRLFRVPCYYMGAAGYAWGLPVEGVTAVVDTDRRTVVSVTDTGVVPVGDGGDPASFKTRAALKPVVNTSPQGANFELRGGYQVKWQNWSFHLRVERREGPVVSLVKYNDSGSDRLIAYQMALSEMIVPYMDPDPNWSYRSFLDVGEFGLGYLASTLRVGHDCPKHSGYLDAVIPSDQGGLFKADRAVCIFERNPSDPAWRHYEAAGRNVNSRANVELVVRMIPTIGNYDYVVDFIFTLHGNIRVRVGATGIDAVKAVAAKSMTDPSAANDARFGALVAPNTVAVYHDHYFSFRLDLDVDGRANSLVRDHIVAKRLPEGYARRSLWVLEPETVEQEGPVDRYVKGRGVWRVVNRARRTKLGHHPSYQLATGHRVTSLLDPSDGPQRRAAFSAHELWVTRHAAEERHAAGRYLNQKQMSGGLPAFVADKAAVENQDIVLWYTLGFHHITRAEDWPVLPTRWHEFTLRPVNFFGRSPAIDLAPSFQAPKQPDLRQQVN